MKVVQCSQPWSGSWRITPRNGVILRTQYGYLLQTNWILISVLRWVSVGEYKSILLRLQITTLPPLIVTLFISPLHNDWVTGVTEHLASTEHIILAIWLLKPFLWRWPYGKHLHRTLITLCGVSFCLVKRSMHISLPQIFVTNFPILFLLSPWLSSQTISHSPWISM